MWYAFYATVTWLPWSYVSRKQSELQVNAYYLIMGIDSTNVDKWNKTNPKISHKRVKLVLKTCVELFYTFSYFEFVVCFNFDRFAQKWNILKRFETIINI